MDQSGIYLKDCNGLNAAQPTLPFSYYRDANHHRLELERIWSRNWIYLCRAESIGAVGEYRLFEVAGREVVLLRDESGALAAFFNSCRHRGSALCRQEVGHFHRNRITCPYHSWTYDLQGRLRTTGAARPAPDFVREDHALSPVAVVEWGGFVFVNLEGGPARAFESALGEELAMLANWPLAELRVAHRFSKRLDCNWKVFWENFNECLHCPKVHPDLCKLVPIYGRGLMVRKDDPNWRDHADDDNPRVSGGLRHGAVTWSSDGLARSASFKGLTDSERERGHTYGVALPSLFVVGHVDYVRSVRVTPLGPEEMRIDAEWLMTPEALADPGLDARELAAFAEQVMVEDGTACELNQRGLRSAAEAHGVLMPEEYEVFAFQEWVRRELGETTLSTVRTSRASRRQEAGVPGS